MKYKATEGTESTEAKCYVLCATVSSVAKLNVDYKNDGKNSHRGTENTEAKCCVLCVPCGR